MKLQPRTLAMPARRLGAQEFATWLEQPNRARSPELDFGGHWTLLGDAGWICAPVWRLSWVDDTGELYAVASSRVNWHRQNELGQWSSTISLSAPRSTVVGHAQRETGVAIVFKDVWRSRGHIEAQLKGWATEPLVLDSFLANSEASALLRTQIAARVAQATWN